MRISEQWLRDWVAVDEPAPQLGARLTMAGLEVDAVEPAAPDFEGVVVGEILAAEPHPQADRLQVCQVAAGGEPVAVVCGARNARAGLKAPFARVGARLPGGHDIKRARLRGVESQGMLCSARELGLAEDAAGLMELPAEAPAGADLRDYLALDDTVIEVELTPNRADCLGMAGVAREVGVLLRQPVSGPELAPVAPAVDDRFPVALESPADCPRYLGRVVRGVDPRAPTPLWMRERLRRAGLRPLSAAVDITNYVMLELGQPMHAFDLGRLAGGIRVRRADSGERLELLNGETVELDPDTLVIADQQGPIAMAGIMGGAPTAVSDATADVLLEAAFFAPLAIAGRARRYGLHTDSSHRFERGVDPELARSAMERATALLLAVAGGRPGPVVEAVDEASLPAQPQVTLRRERIRRLLGMAVADADVEDILRRLGMSLDASSEGWSVRPPSWRFDIAREVDLIEEVARIVGYDNIPEQHAPAPLAMAPRPERLLALRRLRSALVDRGYQEAIGYSFVAPDLQAGLDPDCPALQLANPISADLAVMRTSLWPGLVRALQHNRNRQQERVRLFETGLRFRGSLDDLLQQRVIAGLVSGPVWPEQWAEAGRPADFHDVKGDLEALLALTGRPEEFHFQPAAHPALHPGQSAQVCAGEHVIGWLGALHPRLLRELDLEGAPVLLFELALDDLQRARLPAFQGLSRFPSIRRDLAVVVAEEVAAADLRREAAAAAGEQLRELVLFDVYRGPGLPEGSKSIAMGLILQDSSRTLTDSEGDNLVGRVTDRLRERLDASLRE